MPTTPTTSGGGNSWNTRPQLQKDPLGWVMAAAAEAKNCVSPRNFPRSPSKGNVHWEKSRPKVLLQKNPLVWLVSGLAACLILVSLSMFFILEDTIRKVSEDVLPTPGLDSRGVDVYLENEQTKLNSLMNAGGGMDYVDPTFKHNWFGQIIALKDKSALNGPNGKMVEALANFGKVSDDLRKQRFREGIRTTRETYEHAHLHAYDNLSADMAALRKMNNPLPTVTENVPYDVYNCPDQPPEGYPFSWNVLDVLDNWNPDDTELPSDAKRLHQGLCVFDHDKPAHQAKMNTYRTAEVPFVVQHYPEVMKTTKRWNDDPDYLQKLIGNERIRNEHSENNHFMYWKLKGHGNGEREKAFVPPTDMVDSTFDEWKQRAQNMEKAYAEAEKPLDIYTPPVFDQTKEEHWYFRLNGMLEKQHSYLYEEFPIFNPVLKPDFCMIDRYQHRGINCRFGMRGVIAESHFDSSSNFIAVMGGERRYILAHPDQCEGMELFPQTHPSGRHSSVNWSTAAKEMKGNPDHASRPFANAKVTEVVLQAGDMLYLPTFWFHFIVSLVRYYYSMLL